VLLGFVEGREEGGSMGRERRAWREGKFLIKFIAIRIFGQVWQREGLVWKTW